MDTKTKNEVESFIDAINLSIVDEAEGANAASIQNVHKTPFDNLINNPNASPQVTPQPLRNDLNQLQQAQNLTPQHSNLGVNYNVQHSNVSQPAQNMNSINPLPPSIPSLELSLIHI